MPGRSGPRPGAVCPAIAAQGGSSAIPYTRSDLVGASAVGESPAKARSRMIQRARRATRPPNTIAASLAPNRVRREPKSQRVHLDASQRELRSRIQGDLRALTPFDWIALATKMAKESGTPGRQAHDAAHRDQADRSAILAG